jgi:RNA polymerase sigma-70 factor (ECF subfamily)
VASPIARPRRAPAGFEEFWRAAYRRLLAAVMYAGAAEDVAHDAVAAAMEEVLRRWDSIDDPFAYAQRAVVTHFIKDEMGPRRVAGRVIARGAVAGEYEDSRLTLWEDGQWVGQLLASLPAAQRDVMALIVDEFGPAEVARLLGKNPAAVRQNLRAARRRLQLALSGEERP